MITHDRNEAISNVRISRRRKYLKRVKRQLAIATVVVGTVALGGCTAATYGLLRVVQAGLSGT